MIAQLHDKSRLKSEEVEKREGWKAMRLIGWKDRRLKAGKIEKKRKLQE